MEQEAKAFGKRMFSVVTNGYLSLGLAIGAEQGLFTAMGKFDGPVSAGEIANEAGCKERYVREWLGFMTAGAVVESSEAGGKFFLPLAHRATLASPLVAEYSTYIPRLPTSHNHLTAAFKKDGPPGIPYEVTSPLMALWQKDRANTMAGVLPGLISLVPDLRNNLENGISVCDIGCGQGHLVLWMASTYPACRVTGIDVDTGSIEHARSLAAAKQTTNASFAEHDAARLPAAWTGGYELVIMYDVLHDIPHASRACAEFHRILKPGGRLVVVDVNVSSDPAKNKGDVNALMTFPFSLYHCMSTSLSVEGSEGVGACAGREKLSGLITQAGFSKLETHDLRVNNIAPGLVCFTTSKEGDVSSSI